MATKKVATKKTKRGIRMTKGSGYRISPSNGKTREFKGTLIDTINLGSWRLAIFSVPK